jgi:hypothetical protein
MSGSIALFRLRSCVAITSLAVAALAGTRNAAAQSASAGAPADPSRWGILATMAGKYYWYRIANDDPKASFIRVDWSIPGKILRVVMQVKKKVKMVSQYQLDETTGELLGLEAVPKQIRYVTLHPSGRSLTEFGYVDGKAIRGVTTQTADGSFDESFQSYSDGGWTDYIHVKLAEASSDELVALGFVKKN